LGKVHRGPYDRRVIVIVGHPGDERLVDFDLGNG
jgi:hypothetical protein